MLTGGDALCPKRAWQVSGPCASLNPRPRGPPLRRLMLGGGRAALGVTFDQGGSAMSCLVLRLAAVAAVTALLPTEALSHCFVGSRFFPATLKRR
jgi:hypothetical protein